MLEKSEHKKRFNIGDVESGYELVARFETKNTVHVIWHRKDKSPRFILDVEDVSGSKVVYSRIADSDSAGDILSVHSQIAIANSYGIARS